MSSPAERVSDSVPWYNQPRHDLPFSLVKKISSAKCKPETFCSIAPFPWNVDSAVTLWDGQPGEQQLGVEPDFSRWKEMLLSFSDAVAVGSPDEMFIFFIRQKREPIRVEIPPSEQEVKRLSTDCVNVAWILGEYAPFEPLVAFSRGNVTYIYNIKRNGIASYLRGHGGAITSIAVHPTKPSLFCTTSRDASVRIYALKFQPQSKPHNPHWPPSTQPSLAGAAHGLHMSESEGSGLGRCVIVLMGGRSGGHRAAVLGAAFHPKIPIIATCGVDRTVKIWLVPPISGVSIKGEDKPLFSCGQIHKARVLSVTWLQNDMLATHSAAALMRVDSSGGENKESYTEPGEFITWRWLGMNRFFPPAMEDVRQVPLRGCSSDYQESSSFKIISMTSFPSVESQLVSPKLNIFQSATHDAVAVYTVPGSSSCSIFCVGHVPPGTLSLFSQKSRDGVPSNDEPLKGSKPIRMQSKDLFTQSMVPGRVWTLTNVASNAGILLHNCMFAMGGSVLVGVGTEGSVLIWKLLE